jgi:hypothetical protein
MSLRSVYAVPLALAFVSLGAGAANIAVGPTATGNGSGTDWNNVAQWSSVSPVRGNTYYLRAGTYGGKTVSTAASGTTPITIKKCAAGEGICTSLPGWQDSMGSAEAVFTDSLWVNTSYWVIDGTTGGGPGSWKSGHGFKWTSPAGTNIAYVRLADGVSNIVVRHVKFEQVGNVDVSRVGGTGIYDAGSLYASTFEYLYFENLGALPWFLRTGSGNIFQYNYSGHICGISIADYTQHCEAVVIHAMNDIHFRWNFIMESPSSGGFVKNETTSVDAVRIYGNVFGNGFPINCNWGPCTNWRIFNNTFYNLSSGPVGGDGAYTNLYLQNNVIYNATFTSGLPGTHDYNWYSKVTTGSCSMNPAPHENVTKNYPNACDKIGDTQNPFVNPSGTSPEDWRLTAPIAGWPGVDVCTLDPCTGENKYNLDAFGVERGAGGAWSLGAYEFASGTPTSLASPTNLRVVP